MGKIAYSAIILDEKSRSLLLNKVKDYIPKDWEVIAHHMTINMGEIDPKYERYLGMRIPLNVKKIGISKMCMAVEVDGFFTINNIPHITIAVNRKEGGKPKMSNEITSWKPINKFTITGKVEEIMYK